MSATPSPHPAGESPARKRRRGAEFQPRDRDVVDPFGRRDIRFAETWHLAAFLVPQPFPTYDALRLRMCVLHEKLHYLDRPGQRIKPEKEPTHRLSHEKRVHGRPQDVWALGSKTAELYELAGDWRKNNSRLSRSSFQHPLMVTRLYATLRAAQARGILELEKWIRESGFEIESSVGKTRVDGGAQLYHPASDEGKNVFFECDNNSEPLERKDFLKNPDESFLRKTTVYWHYWDEVFRQGEKKPLLVITTAPTPERAERLRRTAARTDPHGRGLNVFWFTDETKWDPREPERFLYDPIFTTAAGETRSLFRPALEE